MIAKRFYDLTAANLRIDYTPYKSALLNRDLSDARQRMAVLGYGGRISVVGRSGGGVPEFNTASLFFKRNRIGGVSVGDYTPDQSQEAWRKLLGCLDGKRPVVDAVFPSDQVRGAFARLAEGPMGKVLVQW